MLLYLKVNGSEGYPLFFALNNEKIIRFIYSTFHN